MKALVTGAGGFIGRHLVRHLRKRGWRVLCVDLARPRGMAEDDRIRWHVLDCGDRQALRQARLLDGVDVVFHLAGLTRAWNLSDFRAANVRPTQWLLEAALEARPGPKRFVYVSSQAAAGPARSLDNPCVENDTPHPIEAYGQSKMEAEALVQSFGDQIPYTLIRPGGVYGPGDRDYLEILKWMNRGVTAYPGTHHQWTSTIYVEDLVRGMVDATLSPQAANQCYFLCHPEPLPWTAIYALMAHALGRKPSPLPLILPYPLLMIAARINQLMPRKNRNRVPPLSPHKVRLSRPRYWVASPQAAINDFGFSPRTSMDHGLAATVRWSRAAGWL